MFPTVNFLGTPIDTYGLCVMLSLIVVFVATLVFRPKAFPLEYVFWGVVTVFLFAFLGALLFNILLYGSKGETIKMVILDAGLAYLGAPILGFFALWLFCKLIRVPFLVIADFVAPLFMLERMIGRLGCLAYGCCYGIPSNLPWAYAFKSWGIANVVPRHPTQAYELISALAIFASSVYLYKRTKNIRGVPDEERSQEKSIEELKQILRKVSSSGFIFFYVWLCYSFLRFWNEFLRAEGLFIYGPFKLSHLILSIFVIISVIGLFITVKKSAAKEQILKALKSATLRLVLWLVGSGVVILTALSLRSIF